MKSRIDAARAIEEARAREAASRHDWDVAFHHLERAHVLGQQDTRAHVRVHWQMLRLGLATGDAREVAGQAVRIVAAALFSRIWVPLGNTGRANVGALKPMPIPDDLAALMAESRGEAKSVPSP